MYFVYYSWLFLQDYNACSYKANCIAADELRAKNITIYAMSVPRRVKDTFDSSLRDIILRTR